MLYVGVTNDVMLVGNVRANADKLNSDGSRYQTKLDIPHLELSKHGEMHDLYNGVRRDDADKTFTSKGEGNLKENGKNIKIKANTDSADTNQGVHLMFNTSAHSASRHRASTVPSQDKNNQIIGSRKKILFYTKFFSQSWNLPGEMAMQKCPIPACTFLQHSSSPEDADAVIFHADDFNVEAVPSRRRPEQLYIWFTLEAPNWNTDVGLLVRLQPHLRALGKLLEARTYGRARFFNWTMTYHRASDVMLPYGTMRPLTGGWVDHEWWIDRQVYTGLQVDD